MKEAPPTIGPSNNQPATQQTTQSSTRTVPGVDANRLNARKRTPCKWFLSPKVVRMAMHVPAGHFAIPGQRR